MDKFAHSKPTHLKCPFHAQFIVGQPKPPSITSMKQKKVQGTKEPNELKKKII